MYDEASFWQEKLFLKESLYLELKSRETIIAILRCFYCWLTPGLRKKIDDHDILIEETQRLIKRYEEIYFSRAHAADDYMTKRAEALKMAEQRTLAVSENFEGEKLLRLDCIEYWRQQVEWKLGIYNKFKSRTAEIKDMKKRFDHLNEDEKQVVKTFDYLLSRKLEILKFFQGKLERSLQSYRLFLATRSRNLNGHTSDMPPPYSRNDDSHL